MISRKSLVSETFELRGHFDETQSFSFLCVLFLLEYMSQSQIFFKQGSWCLGESHSSLLR